MAIRGFGLQRKDLRPVHVDRHRHVHLVIVASVHALIDDGNVHHDLPFARAHFLGQSSLQFDLPQAVDLKCLPGNLNAIAGKIDLSGIYRIPRHLTPRKCAAKADRYMQVFPGIQLGRRDHRRIRDLGSADLYGLGAGIDIIARDGRIHQLDRNPIIARETRRKGKALHLSRLRRVRNAVARDVKLDVLLRQLRR